MPRKAQMNANYRRNEKLLEDGQIDVPGSGGSGSEYTAGTGISIIDNIISNTKPYNETDVRIGIKYYTDNNNIAFTLNDASIGIDEMYHLLMDWYLGRICGHILYTELPTYGGKYNELYDITISSYYNDEDLETHRLQAKYSDTKLILDIMEPGFDFQLTKEPISIFHYYTSFGELASDIIAHPEAKLVNISDNEYTYYIAAMFEKTGVMTIRLAMVGSISVSYNSNDKRFRFNSTTFNGTIDIFNSNSQLSVTGKAYDVNTIDQTVSSVVAGSTIYINRLALVY